MPATADVQHSASSAGGGFVEQWSQPPPEGFHASDGAGTSAGGPHAKTYDEIQRVRTAEDCVVRELQADVCVVRKGNWDSQASTSGAGENRN